MEIKQVNKKSNNLTNLQYQNVPKLLPTKIPKPIEYVSYAKLCEMYGNEDNFVEANAKEIISAIYRRLTGGYDGHELKDSDYEDFCLQKRMAGGKCDLRADIKSGPIINAEFAASYGKWDGGHQGQNYKAERDARVHHQRIIKALSIAGSFDTEWINDIKHKNEVYASSNIQWYAFTICGTKESYNGEDRIRLCVDEIDCYPKPDNECKKSKKSKKDKVALKTILSKKAIGKSGEKYKWEENKGSLKIPITGRGNSGIYVNDSNGKVRISVPKHLVPYVSDIFNEACQKYKAATITDSGNGIYVNSEIRNNDSRIVEIIDQLIKILSVSK